VANPRYDRGVARTPPDDGGGSNFGGSFERPFDPAAEPGPWFLRPWVLALWGVLVITLIAVIIWGLLELAHGSGGGRPTPTKPSTTTTSAAPTTTTTTTSATAPTSSSPPSPTGETPTVAPPKTAPAPGTAPPTHGHPHRQWWTDLPTTRLPGFPP
jgi:hypothetical protein